MSYSPEVNFVEKLDAMRESMKKLTEREYYYWDRRGIAAAREDLQRAEYEFNRAFHSMINCGDKLHDPYLEKKYGLFAKKTG